MNIDEDDEDFVAEGSTGELPGSAFGSHDNESDSDNGGGPADLKLEQFLVEWLAQPSTRHFWESQLALLASGQWRCPTDDDVLLIDRSLATATGDLRLPHSSSPRSGSPRVLPSNHASPKTTLLAAKLGLLSSPSSTGTATPLLGQTPNNSQFFSTVDMQKASSDYSTTTTDDEDEVPGEGDGAESDRDAGSLDDARNATTARSSPLTQVVSNSTPTRTAPEGPIEQNPENGQQPSSAPTPSSTGNGVGRPVPKPRQHLSTIPSSTMGSTASLVSLASATSSQAVRADDAGASYRDVPQFFFPSGDKTADRLDDSLIQEVTQAYADGEDLQDGDFELVCRVCGLSSFFAADMRYACLRDAARAKQSVLAQSTDGVRTKATRESASTEEGTVSSRFTSTPGLSLEDLKKRVVFGGTKGQGEAATRSRSGQDEAGMFCDDGGFVGCKENAVNAEMFCNFWHMLTSNFHDPYRRAMFLLNPDPTNPSLAPEHFKRLLKYIVHAHPGLDFLKESPEYHERYSDTVIARIFYSLNRSWSGRITLSELKRGDFLSVLEFIDEEPNINKETRFFSYEHFYVIYTSFWKLDTDRNLFISPKELNGYGGEALSPRVQERIFSGAVWTSKKSTKDRMHYPDFVYFILSEEDKTTPTAIEYWFRVMDIDGDGIVSLYELELFYNAQVDMLTDLGIDHMPFKDTLCLILDILNPRNISTIRLADFKRCGLVARVFNTFLNVNKYLDQEETDEVDPDVDNGTPWTRFVTEEYAILSAEEEDEDEDADINSPGRQPPGTYDIYRNDFEASEVDGHVSHAGDGDLGDDEYADDFEEGSEEDMSDGDDDTGNGSAAAVHKSSAINGKHSTRQQPKKSG